MIGRLVWILNCVCSFLFPFGILFWDLLFFLSFSIAVPWACFGQDKFRKFSWKIRERETCVWWIERILSGKTIFWRIETKTERIGNISMHFYNTHDSIEYWIRTEYILYTESKSQAQPKIYFSLFHTKVRRKTWNEEGKEYDEKEEEEEA